MFNPDRVRAVTPGVITSIPVAGEMVEVTTIHKFGCVGCINAAADGTPLNSLLQSCALVDCSNVIWVKPETYAILKLTGKIDNEGWLAHSRRKNRSPFQ